MTWGEAIANAGWAPLMVLVAHQARRKLSADLQARIGPSFAGPRGMFQGLADFAKWVVKRGVPSVFSRSLSAALRNGLILSLALYCLLIPLSAQSRFAGTTEPGDLWPLAPLGVVFLAAVLSLVRGLYQHDPLLRSEAMRTTSQMIPAALAATTLVAAIACRASGFDWREIVVDQSSSVLRWHIFRDPFCFLGWMLFMVSGWVLFQQPPFNPRVAGLRMDLAEEFLRRLFRDFGFYGWSLLTVHLFLGGWTAGAWTPEGTFGQMLLLQFKALGLAVLSTWIQASIPGLNQVQASEFALRVLVPASFGVLLGVGIWMGVAT